MTRAIARAAMIVALAMGGRAYGDPISLTLDPPNGEVGGLPGRTVGWGFDIVNNTTDYMVIDGTYYCESGQDPVNGPIFTCGPNLGASSYTDLLAMNTGILAPGETIQVFDGVTNGIGAYAIDPAAVAGSTDLGSLVIVYDLYDSTFSNELAANQELTAAAPVTVSPEPNTAASLAGALLIAAVAARRHGRRAARA